MEMPAPRPALPFHLLETSAEMRRTQTLLVAREHPPAWCWSRGALEDGAHTSECYSKACHNSPQQHAEAALSAPAADQQVLRDMGPYIALAPRPNKPIKPTKKAALKDNDTEDDDHEDA